MRRARPRRDPRLAAKIADLSQKASGWFPKGTGPELGKTGAKPEIWQNPKDFAAKLSQFPGAARAFNAAAASGDLNAIKARGGDLGQALQGLPRQISVGDDH